MSRLKSNQGRKKKRRVSLVVFVIELIALVVLVAAIFIYARVNSGLRNLGTSASHNDQTAAGTVAAQQQNAAEAGAAAGQTAAANGQKSTRLRLLGV